MAVRRWSDLSDRNRRLIAALAVLDGVLKAAALVDLRRRAAEELRGSKKVWGLAITFSNSAGLVPLAYFLLGRRKRGTD
jgi:hypothetical protein